MSSDGAAGDATDTGGSSTTNSGASADGGSWSDGGAQVSATIGAAGGSLTSADGRATVTIPPGALDADTLVTIAPATAGAAPLVGSAYEIGPTGQQFKAPIRLAIKVDTNALGGAPASSLRLGTLAADGWRAMGVARIDDAAGTVSGETTHFSIYGLIRTICQNDDDCALPERCIADAAGAAAGLPKTCGIPCRSGANGPIDCPAPLVCREGRCLEQSCSFLDPECPDNTNCYIPTVAGVPADAIPGWCRGEACTANQTDPVGDFFVANSGCGLPPNQLLACPWVAEGLSSCDFILCDATHACPEGHSCVLGTCLLTSAGCSCDAPGCPCTPAGGPSDGGTPDSGAADGGAIAGGSGDAGGASAGLTGGGASDGGSIVGNDAGDAANCGGGSCDCVAGRYANSTITQTGCTIDGPNGGQTLVGASAAADPTLCPPQGETCCDLTFTPTSMIESCRVRGGSCMDSTDCVYGSPDATGTCDMSQGYGVCIYTDPPVTYEKLSTCTSDTECAPMHACVSGYCQPCTAGCTVGTVCSPDGPTVCVAYGNGCSQCAIQ